MNLETRILNTIAQALNLPSINIECSIQYLGLDQSENAKKVADSLNNTFGIELVGDNILHASNLEAIITCVKQCALGGHASLTDHFNALFKDLRSFDKSYSDACISPKIPDYIISQIRRDHKLDNKTTIFYYQKFDSQIIFILTSDGISYRKDSNTLIQYKWQDIDRVEYNREQKKFYFYLSDNCDNYYSLSSAIICIYLCFSSSSSSDCLIFAKRLTSFCQTFENESRKSLYQMCDIIDKEEYNTAIELANKIENSIEYSDLLQFHTLRAEAYIYLIGNMDKPDENTLNKAYGDLEKAFNLYDNEENPCVSKPEIQLLYGVLCLYRNDLEDARDFFMLAIAADDDTSNTAREYLGIVEEKLKDTWQNYTTHYDKKERKYVMFAKDIAGCYDSNIKVFKINNFPPCFNFSTITELPTVGELYVEHPYTPGQYVPFNESESIFFNDRVDELCTLMQSLGATEISITTLKGKNINEVNKTSLGGGIEGNSKVFSGAASSINSKNSIHDCNDKSITTLVQKYDPIREPYIPENLVWYHKESNWKRLAQQRLNGNLLEHSQTISTAQNKIISSSETTDIQASFNCLIVKIKGSCNSTSEHTLSNFTETEWKIDVKFKSQADFPTNKEVPKPNNQQTSPNKLLSNSEETYKEEVLFCLEDDNIISNEERQFLERKRVKLGISQDVATEIEKQCLANTLTNEEKEYLEELRESISFGTITDTTRRLLNRVHISLNITEERAKELEAMLNK